LEADPAHFPATYGRSVLSGTSTFIGLPQHGPLPPPNRSWRIHYTTHSVYLGQNPSALWYFRALATNGTVTAIWRMAVEIESKGFDLFRWDDAWKLEFRFTLYEGCVTGRRSRRAAGRLHAVLAATPTALRRSAGGKRNLNLATPDWKLPAMSAPDAVPPLLDLRHVTKRHAAAGAVAAVPVLDGVSLEVRRGAALAIVGPSGSGKSTLLQIIGTLDRPDSGTVTLDGQDLAALDEDALAAVRNRKLGFVFQSHFLLPQCTALENVLVPTLARTGRPSGFAPGEASVDRARRLLDRVGLGQRLDHRPGQLSGGERQRVAVVRALINEPSLLLADEPTGALDHASATALGQLLIELNREEGVTLIVATHALDLAQRMGRVLKLLDGKLVGDSH